MNEKLSLASIDSAAFSRWVLGGLQPSKFFERLLLTRCLIASGWRKNSSDAL